MLAWFGGIEVDLRDAELAPGARLSAHTLFGGIEINAPPSWRVESNVKALAGGVDVRVPSQGNPDAPVLTLEGMAVFGGIDVSAEEGRGRRELAQLLQGTSERLAAPEHGLEQVAVLFDSLERLAHPEASRCHVLC